MKKILECKVLSVEEYVGDSDLRIYTLEDHTKFIWDKGFSANELVKVSLYYHNVTDMETLKDTKQ